MAFNPQVFRTRALTALVFVLVMLAGLFWNRWSYIALFVIIHFGCWWEFVKLMKKIYGNRLFPRVLSGLLYITLPCLLMVQMGVNSFSDIGWWNTSPAYENFELGGRFLLFSVPLLPYGIIAALWINDTMAYIVGSFIGRTPLSSISPKKTWEGTIGGILLSTVVTAFLFSWWSRKLGLADDAEAGISWIWVIVAFVASIAGTFGDLLESKIKRMAGVKDSGQIMPGHGGFLDRFDSLLLAVPAVWLVVELLALF